jgi:hypothetical protein
MLVALATDSPGLLAVAGPLQVAALVFYLATIAPLLPGLPGPTRPALIAATALLVVGIALGAAFALHPPFGVRLRAVHAVLNLFGWTGLLICGVGYYLVPRFAGQPLRWPRLAVLQLGLVGGGTLLGAVAWLWRAVEGAPPGPAVVAQALIASGFVLFGAMVAGTFRRRPGITTAAVTIKARPDRIGGVVGSERVATARGEHDNGSF